MISIYSEKLVSDFEGTIIDIETIGDFCWEYRNRVPADSRLYQNISPVIFGYINDIGLKIHCAKNLDSVEELKTTIIQLLPTLKKPFYAFNCEFEKGVIFHSCETVVNFNGELKKMKYENKGDAVSSLSIENYDDPFYDAGRACKRAWEQKRFDLAIWHNRSCLLKERDILLKRDYRKPDELTLNPITNE